MPDNQLLAGRALESLDRMAAIVAALDDETAHSRPRFPGSRSPRELLDAGLDVLRGWSGAPAGRTASGTVAELLDEVVDVRAAFTEAVEAAATDAVEPLLHVVTELARQLGSLETTRDAVLAPGRVRQLRLVVEADDFDRAVRFYRDVVGLHESLSYQGEGDERGVILDVGHATLALNTPAAKRAIDLIEMDAASNRGIDDAEVGHPTPSPIRVAFEVPDAERLSSRLVDAGAVVIAPVVATPWGSLAARFQAPAGLELTVFQESPPAV